MKIKCIHCPKINIACREQIANNFSALSCAFSLASFNNFNFFALIMIDDDEVHFLWRCERVNCQHHQYEGLKNIL
jgi:hypothetical protein